MPHLVLQNCLCKSNVIFLTSQWGEHSLVERYLDSDLLVILLTNLLGIWLIWVLSDSYVFCVHTYLRENCLTSTNKQRKASWCQNLSCSSQVGRSILRIAIRNCCYIYIYTYLSYTLQNERTEPKKKGRNLFISRRFPDSFWVECSGSSSSPWFCAFEMFGEQRDLLVANPEVWWAHVSSTICRCCKLFQNLVIEINPDFDVCIFGECHVFA